MTTWRVGVWCAVSSKPQADPEKESLPAQERAGHEFAAAIGGEVVRVYTVPGHSRDYVFWQEAEREMPAYQMIREDLEAGKLDVVHCIDSDRLGRDAALIQQFYSLAQRHSCEVYDASMPHPLGQQHTGHRYGVAVKGVAAQEDQRRRVARQASGMRGKVRRGLPPYSQWPTGYSERRDEQGRCVGAELNEEIGAVELMTALFLQGASYDTILQALWRAGWRRRGGPWYHSAVWRVLHNDIYAGYVHWKGARNEQVSDKFPALWDQATYAAILRERERRGSDWTHPAGGPLSGIVYCARCGHRMGHGTSDYRDDPYLRCNTHASRHRSAEGRSCHPNHIRLSVIVGALSVWLDDLRTPERLDVALAHTTGQDTLEAERDRLQARLDDIEVRRRRLALALAAGAMEIGIYSETDRVLLGECAGCQDRLAELHTLIATWPDPAERRAQMEALIQSRIDNPASPAVTSALRLAGVRVWCENRRVVLIGFVV